MKEGKEAINIVWQALFPVKFSENEYAEIVFDEGDKVFKYAYHVQSLEELESFVEEYNGRINIAICPNTREPKKIERRTGKEAVRRQKAILLDIEDPDKHELTSPQKVRELIRKVVNAFPESLRKAGYYSAYTGGGGQICILLSRWIEGGEIDIVYEWLREQLKGIRYIDSKSFNYGQPQRLIGTVNVKYGVKTFIYKVNERVEPLDVDRILATWTARQELENYVSNQIDENRGRIKNLREAINEIKRKIRFKDLGFDGENCGDYTKLLCPFHEENNPSFIVYHNEEGDLGIDYHDEEYYDIIKFYQKIYEKDFITAVRELAQKAGIKLVFSKEEKKKIEKEQALANFDPYEYLSEELRIVSAVRYRINGEYWFDIFVENREGETVRLSTSLFKILEPKYALRLFGSHTGFKPAPLPEKAKEEAWERVLDTLFEISDKDEDDFDRSELPWEAEELKRIIREAPATDYMPDFLPSKSRYVKFYDADTGTVFVSLTALLRRAKVYPSLERMNIRKVSELLRLIGARPDKLYKDGYEVRVWRLPEGDWRITDTTDTSDTTTDSYSVGVKNIDRVSSDGITDTTDTIFTEKTGIEKTEKNQSEVSADMSEVYGDNGQSTDTNNFETDFKNEETVESQVLENTDTTDTNFRREVSELSDDDWDVDEIPF